MEDFTKKVLELICDSTSTTVGGKGKSHQIKVELYDGDLRHLKAEHLQRIRSFKRWSNNTDKILNCDLPAKVSVSRAFNEMGKMITDSFIDLLEDTQKDERRKITEYIISRYTDKKKRSNQIVAVRQTFEKVR